MMMMMRMMLRMMRLMNMMALDDHGHGNGVNNCDANGYGDDGDYDERIIMIVLQQLMMR